jgi:hypothetical protein
MSNHEEEFDAHALPDADEVDTSRGMTSYRIANGALCQGSEKRGNLVTVSKALGKLLRISIHEGTGKDDGVWFQRLEADFETNKGPVRIHAPLSNAGVAKPGIAATSFAEGLLDLALHEVAVVEPDQSVKPNRFGSYTTFARVYHYDVKTGKTRSTLRRDRNPNQTLEDQWAELEAELRDHPAYKDRKAEAADTHLSLLSAECKAKGWPTPEENPEGYVKMCQEVLGDPMIEKLSDIDEELWGEVREGFNQPGAVCPSQIVVAATKAATDKPKGRFSGR